MKNIQYDLLWAVLCLLSIVCMLDATATDFLVHKVNDQKWPDIGIEISVYDVKGSPVSDLNLEDFYVFIGERFVASLEIAPSASARKGIDLLL